MPQQTELPSIPGKSFVQHRRKPGLTRVLASMTRGESNSGGVDALQNLARSGLVKKLTIDDLKPFEALAC